jgi:hypothetical protein
MGRRQGKGGDKQRGYDAKYNKKRYARHKAFLNRYKLMCGCALCGYDQHHAPLCFHHLDESKKSFSIGAQGYMSIAKIKLEIRKCVVLCQNCHRIVHEELRHANS